MEYKHIPQEKRDTESLTNIFINHENFDCHVFFYDYSIPEEETLFVGWNCSEVCLKQHLEQLPGHLFSSD